MQKTTLVILWICILGAVAVSAGAHPHPERDKADKRKALFPKLIPVPDGFQPEGVVKGRGHKAYVGSLLTGGIYEVDLVSGKGELLVEQAEHPAVGLAFDRRSGYLFAAGGPSGAVTVFDSRKGTQKAVYAVTEPGTFVNDAIVTRQAAYFTDSFAPFIYKIPLSKDGKLPDQADIQAIELTGEFDFIAGAFNANGIESRKHGKRLIIVNSATGELYAVDPETGETRRIPIANGNVNSGDGLFLRGDQLFVVQNVLNQVAQLELSDGDSSATVKNILTDPEFRIPTTITGFGRTLYAINARFDVAPPPFFGAPPADPSLSYNLVRVRFANEAEVKGGHDDDGDDEEDDDE